ncbi:hypothetical protein FRC02_008997 [Tulasnella sp. 418]|nr:hypothetical protein FRC02_008997 [Tulasnella sp. 418]
MSSEFEGVFDKDEGWDGSIVINVHLEAKDDDAADKVEKVMKEVRASVLDKEKDKGCLLFHVARSGRHFTIFEKYTGADAVKNHFASEHFKAANAKGDQVLTKPPTILYYREIM